MLESRISRLEKLIKMNKNEGYFNDWRDNIMVFLEEGAMPADEILKVVLKYVTDDQAREITYDLSGR